MRIMSEMMAQVETATVPWPVTGAFRSLPWGNRGYLAKNLEGVGELGKS